MFKVKPKKINRNEFCKLFKDFQINHYYPKKEGGITIGMSQAACRANVNETGSKAQKNIGNPGKIT